MRYQNVCRPGAQNAWSGSPLLNSPLSSAIERPFWDCQDLAGYFQFAEVLRRPSIAGDIGPEAFRRRCATQVVLDRIMRHSAGVPLPALRVRRVAQHLISVRFHWTSKRYIRQPTLERSLLLHRRLTGWEAVVVFLPISHKKRRDRSATG